jgi:hypothetical protein
MISKLLQAWQNTLKHTLITKTRSHSLSKEDNYQKYIRELELLTKEKRLEMCQKLEYNPVFNVLLPFTQIPIFVVCSLGLRKACTIEKETIAALGTGDGIIERVQVLTGLAQESCGWVESTVLADSTGILPLFVGALYLCNVEVTNYDYQTLAFYLYCCE